ncbi:hypothetical protein G6F35_015418 [Rhizopus arrhizus]|nr:hypothetical protein G6F35_015418 [Rhizopus arrhizus]
MNNPTEPRLRVAVLGAGSWGTALAAASSCSHSASTPAYKPCVCWHSAVSATPGPSAGSSPSKSVAGPATVAGRRATSLRSTLSTQAIERGLAGSCTSRFSSAGTSWRPG